VDVTGLGAIGDGTTLNTAAIQKAIDQASVAGGGTVLLAGGTFLSGTLELRSHVTLQVDKGAELLGSANPDDYHTERRSALLEARRENDISVCGEGVIDGQGALLATNVLSMTKKTNDRAAHDRPEKPNRPMLIAFVDCHHVQIHGITLKDSSGWVEVYDHCEDLVVDHVTVRSTAYWNNDGIDIVDCRTVHVMDCDVNSSDDGICLKSKKPGRCCEDVLIERCKIRSGASAFKLGAESWGCFRHVRAQDLYVFDTFRSAVALEAVDGGRLEDVDISRVEAKNTGNAIFIRLGHCDKEGPWSSLENVTITDLTADVPASRPDEGYPFDGPAMRERHNLLPCSVTGLPGHPVRNIILKNISITYGGGGRRETAFASLDRSDKIREEAARSPEFTMFGELPAWGFYCRHVEGIQFQNITLGFRSPDFRAAFVADDVKALGLDGFNVLSSGEDPVVLLNDVHAATIRGANAPAAAKEFIREQGNCTEIHRY
jgi:hypothetical protein